MSKTRQLDRQAIAGWLLKANPAIYDVEAALQDRVPFSSWRLAPSYRLELIAPSDPVVLWLTGPDRGVIAAGVVTDVPVTSRGGTEYWVDAEEKAKIRPYLPVRMTPIPKIREEELTSSASFQQAEVIRVRQMGNPSFLTHDELAIVKDLMGPRLVREVGWPPDKS